MSYFPHWKLKTEGIVAPDERLPAGQMFALGIQHVVAMFGSTILAPILMGFDPNESADSPYAMGNMDIMDTIKPITEQQAIEFINNHSSTP
jgi:xanthine/uracil permease